jgi:hypothetical protein
MSDPATSPSLRGDWTELPQGYAIKQLVGVDHQALVGTQIDDRPELFWIDQEGRTTPFHPVPPRGTSWGANTIGAVDPWIAVDLTTPTVQISVTRVEYQGGSWGLVVYPDARTPAFEEIPSPTDSDIGFGVPLILRGDELFTLEPGGSGPLYQYRRDARGWSCTELTAYGEFSQGWAMALSSDAQSLLVASTNEAGSLQLFRRGAAGLMRHARALPVPSEPDQVAFHQGHGIAAFTSKTETQVQVLDLKTGETLRTLHIPATTPSNRSMNVVLAQNVVLVAEERGVHVVDLASASPLAWLEVPLSGANTVYLLAARTLAHVVVAREGGRELGVFDLSAVLPD